MVRALGDLMPRAHHGLEPRERRVNLPSHRSLLGLGPDHLGRVPEKVTLDRPFFGDTLGIFDIYQSESRTVSRVFTSLIAV